MANQLTTGIFISKSKQIHGDKYDYSLVEYKHNSIKVKIICPIHGIFEIMPRAHTYGQGCKQCFIESKYITKEHFINESKEIHQNKYDYSLVDYKSMRNKVTIICPIHGNFSQTPHNHMNCKSGCPKCKLSKGELLVSKILTENKIDFEIQKRFKHCKNPNSNYTLPFDFYLPKFNVCIEFDGEQHYKVARYSSDKDKMLKKLQTTQLNDKIKDEYCLNNNIHLIRIPYWDISNISTIISNYIDYGFL